MPVHVCIVSVQKRKSDGNWIHLFRSVFSAKCELDDS